MNKEKAWYEPACYQIKVTGHLGNQWSNWFEDMTISFKNGVSTISGKVVDQTALHGLLIRIRDLGLLLISVNRIESDSGKYFHQVDEK